MVFCIAVCCSGAGVSHREWVFDGLGGGLYKFLSFCLVWLVCPMI